MQQQPLLYFFLEVKHARRRAAVLATYNYVPLVQAQYLVQNSSCTKLSWERKGGLKLRGSYCGCSSLSSGSACMLPSSKAASWRPVAESAESERPLSLTAKPGNVGRAPRASVFDALCSGAALTP